MAKKAKQKVFLTQKQKSEIIRLKNKGESVKDLAAAYNVSQGVIYNTIRVAPTRKPRKLVTPAIADEMLELRAAGLSMHKIAATLDLGNSSVVRHLNKLGDPLKAKHVGAKPVHMIHTDEGPEIPLVSKKGADLMEGFKLTLGIAAILFLLILGLDQAGML